MPPGSRSRVHDTPSIVALRQVASIAERVTGVPHEARDDGSFGPVPAAGRPEGAAGMANGEIDQDAISLRFVLGRLSETDEISAVALLGALADLGPSARPVPPVSDTAGRLWLSIGLRIAASPLDLARTARLTEQMERLKALSRRIVARTEPTADLAYRARYVAIAEHVEPLSPWQPPGGELPEAVAGHIRLLADLCGAGCPIALVTASAIEADLALALLAAHLGATGGTLGRVIDALIPARVLSALAAKAPGPIALPVVRLVSGTSQYDAADETGALLGVLMTAATPVIFTGDEAALRAAFRGGQGGASDPLCPVVCHFPGGDLPPALRARFAVDHLAAGRDLTEARREAIAARAEAATARLPDRRDRLLPLIVARELRVGGHDHPERAEAGPFADMLASLTATFAARSDTPSGGSAASRRRFAERLSDPGLRTHLGTRLLGQDAALDALCARLTQEALGRPDHQPPRYLVQGTPGTGKSASVALIAAWLGAPLDVIDAASMPSYEQSITQLCGSGRGFVGSHRRGRLEELALSSGPVVVEVADLDRAPRGLADFFRSILETGRMQTGTGALIDCANILFAFTMNLPDGADERLHTPLGFARSPSREGLRADVERALRDTASNAFLSRAGAPILFDPIPRTAIGGILERAIADAIAQAMARIGAGTVRIDVEPGCGARLIRPDPEHLAKGVRGLLEQARDQAIAAVMALPPDVFRSGIKSMVVRVDADRQLLLVPDRTPDLDALFDPAKTTGHGVIA